ncbi:hypothetical protein V6N11_010483 [Hibiscus sabdariffa]|uniref:Uncharacterized protein n=1 Tax=Hibiscus sabdariffa TaxID=183260 RepID=A0ABR2S5I6_9ROSI
MVAANILFHLHRSTSPETGPKSHENGLEASAPPLSATVSGDLSDGKGEVSGGGNTGEGMRQAVKLGAVGSWFGKGECLALMWVMGMEVKGELKWGLCSDGSGGDGEESWK